MEKFLVLEKITAQNFVSLKVLFFSFLKQNLVENKNQILLVMISPNSIH